MSFWKELLFCFNFLKYSLLKHDFLALYVYRQNAKPAIVIIVVITFQRDYWQHCRCLISVAWGENKGSYNCRYALMSQALILEFFFFQFHIFSHIKDQLIYHHLTLLNKNIALNVFTSIQMDILDFKEQKQIQTISFEFN